MGYLVIGMVDPVCVSIQAIGSLFIDVSVIGLSERSITETPINKEHMAWIETHTRPNGTVTGLFRNTSSDMSKAQRWQN